MKTKETTMSDEYRHSVNESRRVRWEVTERGPRVIITICGEDVVITAEQAHRYMDELASVLIEIGAQGAGQ